MRVIYESRGVRFHSYAQEFLSIPRNNHFYTWRQDSEPQISRYINDRLKQRQVRIPKIKRRLDRLYPFGTST
jgi:hypothetical protein